MKKIDLPLHRRPLSTPVVSEASGEASSLAVTYAVFKSTLLRFRFGLLFLFALLLSTAATQAQTVAIDFSQFFGGNDDDEIVDVVVDPTTGIIYVAGNTRSTDFPNTTGLGIAGANTGERQDVFAAAISPDGSTLLWSTVLGGSENDFLNGLDINDNGDVFIAGTTESDDFPVSGNVGAYSSNKTGFSGGFVVRLGSGGSTLDYSSYLGALLFQNDVACGSHYSNLEGGLR